MEDELWWSQDNTLVFPFFQVTSLIVVACLTPACFCRVLVVVTAAPLVGLEKPSSLKVCCPHGTTARADLINNLIPRIKCPVAN